MIGWTVTALHPRLVAGLVVLGAPHPLAVRRNVVRDPRGQGRAVLAGRGHVLAAQVPRRPEHLLRVDDGAHVERLMRQRAGGRWVATDDFTVSVEGNRRAMQVPGVAHSALEYYRWAVRSQARAEGRRFAAAVERRPSVPVLQVHGADDPYLLDEHRGGVAALGRPAPADRGARRDGHFPHAERPAATTSLLLDFLPR